MFLIYLILLMYCFFIIWILDGYKNLIKKNIETTNYSGFISIIVAARNEAHNLPNLLHLLKVISIKN